MSSLDHVLSKFGLPPIECGWNNPNCAGGYTANWGAGVVVPIRDMPPAFPIYVTGGGVISHNEPNQLPIINTATFPNKQDYPSDTPMVLGTQPANVTPLNTTIDTIKAKVQSNPLPYAIAAAVALFLIFKDSK